MPRSPGALQVFLTAKLAGSSSMTAVASLATRRRTASAAAPARCQPESRMGALVEGPRSRGKRGRGVVDVGGDAGLPPAREREGSFIDSAHESAGVARPVAAFLLALAAAIVLVVRVLPLTLAGVSGDRSQLTWRAADGREHVYLGDYDSYLWAREARNYLRTGTTCDAVVAGECRDTFASAPVGVRMRYAHSLHIAAIVGLHRLIRLFAPRHPLTASVFWVPVVVGVLGVLPAFAIGARLAGPVAGVAAALAIGVNPLFIQRSAGGDNDVWNVVLPLYAVWAAIAALAAGSRRRAAALAALAGVVVGLHAATWSGWIFTHLVVLAGLGATVAMRAVASARAHAQRTAPGTDVVGALLVLGGYGVAAAVATALAGVGADALVRPVEVLRTMLAPAQAAAAVSAAPWPDVFQTVAELARPDLQSVAAALFGPLHLFVAWLGLLVLLLPEREWRWGHLAVLIVGVVLYRGLLALTDVGPGVLLALLSLPLAAALVLALMRRDVAALPPPGAYVVGVWFLAALLQAFEGARLIMLLVPPFGVLFGVAIGRLHAWIVRATRPRAGRHARLLPPVLLGVVGFTLVPSVRAGVAAGRDYRPAMHDAWWNTLVGLRETSPPDAIVSTWWDYGHWVKYVAERRVSADGSTLRTHVSHWLGRALLAPTEDETAGLLRMLGCGSDATPEPEGRLGAWGKLVGYGVDPVAAHAMVLAVAGLERSAARAHLIARGLAPAAADDVLESTHCTPPPIYLILSSDMVIGTTWRGPRTWAFRPASCSP
jgi:hypothetical protein